MRLIKKYKNRKMYDTFEKKFITLNEIAQFIKNGEVIRVIDSLGNDVTQEISLKAKIEYDFFAILRKEVIEKLIQGFIKILKGRPDEFVEVLFDLVNQGVISNDVAREIRDLIIRHVNDFNDNIKKDIVEIIKSTGFVPKEEYDALKLEYEKLKEECLKHSNYNEKP